jgi:hypothetical protein
MHDKPARPVQVGRPAAWCPRNILYCGMQVVQKLKANLVAVREVPSVGLF